jgi:hypothetical protein
VANVLTLDKYPRRPGDSPEVRLWALTGSPSLRNAQVRNDCVVEYSLAKFFSPDSVTGVRKSRVFYGAVVRAEENAIRFTKISKRAAMRMVNEAAPEMIRKAAQEEEQ